MQSACHVPRRPRSRVSRLRWNLCLCLRARDPAQLRRSSAVRLPLPGPRLVHVRVCLPWAPCGMRPLLASRHGRVLLQLRRRHLLDHGQQRLRHAAGKGKPLSLLNSQFAILNSQLPRSRLSPLIPPFRHRPQFLYFLRAEQKYSPLVLTITSDPPPKASKRLKPERASTH